MKDKLNGNDVGASWGMDFEGEEEMQELQANLDRMDGQDAMDADQDDQEGGGA